MLHFSLIFEEHPGILYAPGVMAWGVVLRASVLREFYETIRHGGVHLLSLHVQVGIIVTMIGRMVYTSMFRVWPNWVMNGVWC